MQKKKWNKYTGKKRRLPIAFILFVAMMLFVGCAPKETTYFLEEADTEKEETLVEEDSSKIEEKESAIESQSAAMNEETVQESCFVHICGAVENPGVYELPADSRIFEALKAAGGLKTEACGDYLNQAQKVTDGMKIYIPTEEEIQNGEVLEQTEEGIQKEAVVEEETNLININYADKELLMTLPGIGESRAESIITYREECGGFTQIEDIMQVPGIKEGAFQKLKDKICVH